MRFIATFIVAFFILGNARAQSPVFTYPIGQTITNASGSISLTSQFQNVFNSNTGRKSCVIQNTGVHVMYVFFGAIAGATTPTSYPLFPATAAGYPGGYVTCNNGGVVVTDQVSITGTTSDTFTATAQ